MNGRHINRNSTWHSLSEHHQHCVRRGLPINFLGSDAVNPNLLYTDFEIPQEFGNQVVSGVDQRRFIGRLNQSLAPTRYPVGILGIHSAPSDHAAMTVGASIFERAVYRGLVSHCLTLTDIVNGGKYNNIEGDLFLVHTMTEQLTPQYMYPLRDFLRSRATSLRILVMASSAPGDGLRMQNEILRMRDMNVLICLTDSDRTPHLRLS